MYYCNVEKDCLQADVDEPTGEWATSHKSVYDVLVNKRSSAMLVFVLFSTEEYLVSLLCCCEAKDVPTVPVHFVCYFLDFPRSCKCPCVPCAYGNVVSSTNFR